MKLFACDNCLQTLFFENTRCMNCGETVACDPAAARLATLKLGDRLPQCAGTRGLQLAGHGRR